MNISEKLQHGIDWSGQDLAGYWMTEKMNGCRAYWDGNQLWSRGGKIIMVPSAWTLALPRNFALDGEIYDGIDGLYRCSVAAQYGRFTDSMVFMVFDAPDCAGSWQERITVATKKLKHNAVSYCLPYRICRNNQDATKELARIRSFGGEGLMFRHPDIQYTPGRTSYLLKMKYSESA